MPWLDAAEIRNKYNVQAGRFDSQIDYASLSAASILHQILDPDIYAEAVAAEAPEDPDDLIRYNRVLDAHSNLTMYFFVRRVGNKIGPEGIIKAAQDSASPAINSRIITNSYLTPADIKRMADGFLEDAKLALGDYGVIPIGIITVTTTQTSAAVPVTADW